MSTCLIKLIKPYIESINLIEVARHLKVSVGDILKSEFWAFTLWFNVSGRGGVIVSPRKMSFWLVAIKKAIAACIDIESIERLKTALEVEFIRVGASKKQQQIYSDKDIEELRSLVDQRYRQIEKASAAYRQAHTLSESYQLIIKQCSDRQSLHAVGQLIKKNQTMRTFPYLIEQLRRVWVAQQNEILALSRLISNPTLA